MNKKKCGTVRFWALARTANLKKIFLVGEKKNRDGCYRGPIRSIILLLQHLSTCRRMQLSLLFGLMLVGALTEVLTLGAVLPFITVLTVSNHAMDYPFFSEAAKGLNITSSSGLALFSTSLFVSAALVAGTIRLLLLWVTNKLAYACGSELSMEVYRRTLYQPYRIHMARNSSQMMGAIIVKIRIAIKSLRAMMMLLTSIIILVAIVSTLILISPIATVISTASLGALYGVITLTFRKQLQRNSQIIADKQTKVIKALQEGLGGIRDVLLNGLQQVFCGFYGRAEVPLRNAQASTEFIAQSPRVVIETAGIVLISLLICGSFFLQPGEFANSFPLLGALVLGAQKLLPCVQQIYRSWTDIIGNTASCQDILRFLEQPLPSETLGKSSETLPFKNFIHLKNIRFRYFETGPWVLDGLDLVIPKGAKLGVIGETGCGKSTAMDLLMGLILPVEGELIVDGNQIADSKIKEWQNNIAHVPQNIFLADKSFAENIAFGVPQHNIDIERVRKAAQQAQIADFIESQNDGYHAFVGERGVRLSGGQRQRIGIARALFKQADVLVLDEATSALDNSKEEDVMETICKLSQELTIIIIAHRRTTIQRCDIIVKLETGRILIPENYGDSLESNNVVSTNPI